MNSIFTPSVSKGILTLSPNPTQGILSYSLDNQDFTEGTMSIYDLSGRLVFTKKISGKEGIINVENLGLGEFICIVNSGKSIFSNKFVKIQ